METERERWRHRVPRTRRRGAPLSWRTGMTRHRQQEPWQSIFEPWSDPRTGARGRIGGDRCLGILTQAVAQCAAPCIKPSGRPVSGFHFRIRLISGVHRNGCGKRKGKSRHGFKGRMMLRDSMTTRRQKPNGVASSVIIAMPSGMVRHLRKRMSQARRAASARS